MGDDQATRVALARWAVICEVVDERPTPAERGRLVSQLARRVHRDADGRPARVTTRTIYRWLAAWRAGRRGGRSVTRPSSAGPHPGSGRSRGRTPA